jgi:hypothetical protein
MQSVGFRSIYEPVGGGHKALVVARWLFALITRHVLKGADSIMMPITSNNLAIGSANGGANDFFHKGDKSQKFMRRSARAAGRRFGSTRLRNRTVLQPSGATQFTDEASCRNASQLLIGDGWLVRIGALLDSRRVSLTLETGQTCRARGRWCVVCGPSRGGCARQNTDTAYRICRPTQAFC